MKNGTLGQRHPGWCLVLWSVLLAGFIGADDARSSTTYAERLGFGADDRLLILHVDDAGMSHESNIGALRAVLDGAANSLSVMMPCPWIPEMVDALRQHPSIDAGLHLTLTSEWSAYRWGPLAGAPLVPGLVDSQGAMWATVEDVVAHASPDEADAEIRAQLARARSMGFEPTHLDSHMGTVFAHPEFLARYVGLGIEAGIPVMLPGGHNTLLEAQLRAERPDAPGGPLPELEAARDLGRRLWAAGLPVIDDLHNVSYGWSPGPEVHADEVDDRTLAAGKVAQYIPALRSLRPGITMMILHATDAGPGFGHISASGATRRGDMLAMLDPAVSATIRSEGLILVTWRELMKRRAAAGGAQPSGQVDVRNDG